MPIFQSSMRRHIAPPPFVVPDLRSARLVAPSLGNGGFRPPVTSTSSRAPAGSFLMAPGPVPIETLLPRFALPPAAPLASAPVLAMPAAIVRPPVALEERPRIRTLLGG